MRSSAGLFVTRRRSLCVQTSRPARSRWRSPRLGLRPRPGPARRRRRRGRLLPGLPRRRRRGRAPCCGCSACCASEPSALANFAVGSLAIKPLATAVRMSCARRSRSRGALHCGAAALLSGGQSRRQRDRCRGSAEHISQMPGRRPVCRLPAFKSGRVQTADCRCAVVPA